MENESKNPYVQFNEKIFQDWKDNGVNYIKLVELETNLPIKFFELVPNSEIPDSAETIYHIDSEDISELLERSEKVKFLVHEIYLEED